MDKFTKQYDSQLIITIFSKVVIFSLVSQEDSKIKYEYVLKTNVIKIYHEINGDKSYAVLKSNLIY